MLRRKKAVVDAVATVNVDYPKFDKKYKIIFELRGYAPRYYELIDWIDGNTNGSADIKVRGYSADDPIYVAFEDESDATFFKIKYSI
jgi:hypothetical protein